MTREDLIRELSAVIEKEKDTKYHTFVTNLREMAEDCLKYVKKSALIPQPNPETGLVPCGCPRSYVVFTFDKEGKYIRCVSCKIRTASYTNYREAKIDWNAAMGYREGTP